MQADLNNPAYIKKLVKYRLRAIRQMAGINLDTQIRVRMVVIQSMLKNASTMQALMNSIELQSAAKLNLSTHWLNAIKTGVTNTIGRVGTKTKSHLSFGAGILTGAFQVFVLNKLLSDAMDPDAMQNSKIENWARLSVGIAALLGTLGAVIDEGIGKLPPQYIGGFLRGSKTVAASIGKYLGPGAAIAGALVDFYKAGTELSEGNRGVAFLYGASAVAGIVTGAAMLVAVLTTAAIPFFGWILAICAGIMIGDAILIAYFKDNSLQDWVERCSFGKLMDQRYKSLKTEQQELMLAYKGMGA